MKKLLKSALALATVFFAASCTQEKLQPVGSNTVSFKVEIPEVATKAEAVGNDAKMIDDLVYAVYRTTAGSVAEALENWNDKTTFLYAINSPAELKRFKDGTDIISIELLNDQNHIVLLWAQHADVWVSQHGDAIDLTNITYPSDLEVSASCADKYAAFSGVKFIAANDKTNTEAIELTRPFAQINIATVKPENYAVVINSTDVTVNAAGDKFNVASQLPAGSQDITYSWAGKVYDDKLNVNSQNYDHYLAMGYVFAAGNVSVDYTIVTAGHGTITNTITNVPVAKNYRTNIIGNLLTSDVDYNVVLDKNWEDDGANMDVICEGLVVNINGDYEISTSEGLAYAINNKFQQGGNFYIYPGEYNLNGVTVVPQPFENGVLKVYAEKPVVTRAVNIEGVVIKGLNIDAIVTKVAEGAQAIFSNITIESDTKLVGTNEGVVAIDNCSNEETEVPAELIGNNDNGKMINLATMATVAAITEAINAGLAEIDLTGDVTATDILWVERPVTINGNGYTFTSKATRAINVSTWGEVNINNLTVVGEGSCQRGINIIDYPATVNLDHFTAYGTEDFLYATYIYLTPTEETVATLNIKNSNLTAWAAIALYSRGATVNVVDSHLKGINTQKFVGTHNNQYSVIAFGRDYPEMSVNVTGGSITAQSNEGCEYEFIVGSNEGCTNSSITLDTELLFVGERVGYVNIDPKETTLMVREAYADAIKGEGWLVSDPENGFVTVGNPAARIGNTGYETFEAAVAAAKAGDTITLCHDVTLTTSKTLPADITLNGNGYQINGTINAGGDLTIAGHTKVTAFSAGYYDRVITIGEGDCLEITGTGRVSLAYGNTFNITGSIENAKTADKANIQPSLIIPGGISITGGNDAAMNVTNAYVVIGSTSTKDKEANGTYTLNFKNSIAEFTNQLTFAVPTSGKNPTVNMNVTNSVLTTATKLIAAAPNCNVVIDNSVVTLGTYFRNSGKFDVVNGSVLTGATIQFGENGGNDGALTVDASTVTISASSTGHALDGKGTGSITLKNAAAVTIDYVKDMILAVAGDCTFTCKELLGNCSNRTVVADGVTKDENGAYYVSSAAGLKKMNEMFKDQSAGKNAVMNLDADIDFTGYTWTPVDSHADSRFWISEINGNGHTLSNLTINGQAMFTRFAGVGDVTIKDITFDNANVNSNGNINTSILTVQTYQNVLLDNVDVKNSTIIGGYKVAPLIGTVYNESSSTITATLKNCDVTNTTVKATSYDFCTTGMVAFVYDGDNDKIEFENCTVSNVKLYAPRGYTAHAAIYTTGEDTLYNEAEGVTVSNVTFENI